MTPRSPSRPISDIATEPIAFASGNTGFHLETLRFALSTYVDADAAEACADKLELLRLRTQGVLTAQLQERIARMGRELDQCYATIGRLEEETVRAKSVRERLGRDVSAPGHPGDPEDLL